MIIAQISDTHITLAEGAAANAASGLQRAVTHLLALPARPDLVIITGDCVNTGQPAEYARFRELLRPLPMPVYIIPGNHDDRAQLLDLFGTQGTQPLAGFMQYVVDTWPVRLIALDTNVPGHHHGLLDAERLQWLEERLAEAPTRPTLVFLHHPPLQIGLAPYDKLGLTGADDFGAIIARHPQVERIVAGHVHMALMRRFAGSVVMTCPTTTQTLLPDLNQSERVAVLIEPPACLLHTWQESTGLITYTSLIGDYGPVVEIHDGTQWVA